jgi:hypothetical protein
VLDGFTLTGGNSDGSGDLSVTANGVTATILRTAGGGLYNYSSFPVLTNIVITGNFASVNGGGMYNEGSSPVLTGVTVADNSANGSGANEGGGGIYNNASSSPELTGAAITGNATSGSGGGMGNNASSSPVLTNVAITDNSASLNGGGMANASSTPLLINVLIRGNRSDSLDASSGGGGGMANTLSSPILVNVVITGNSASSANGGGMANASSPYSYSSPLLVNVTMAGNRAAFGGGIANRYSSPTIRNSIIWGNTATGGGHNIYPPGGVITYSIVQGGWTGTGSNNLAANPQFVAPQPASAAPTTAGDYRLTVNSPAINTGNDSDYTSAITIDPDGVDRIKGSHIDMGAYEEPGGVTPGKANITLVIDLGEGIFSEGDFDLSKDGDPDPTTKTVIVTGSGYTNPRWFVDGDLKGTEDSIIINAADYTEGGHSLGISVEMDDGWSWSKEIDFTVGN